MNKNIYIPLNRSVISISGEDSLRLLQGIITNDIERVSGKNAIYTFQLTPQGKYLFDFFISQSEDGYLVDISTSQKGDFLKKLKIYKLRSQVEIKDLSEELEVVSLLGDKVFEKMEEGAALGSVHEFCKGYAYIDPRSKAMYARSIIGRDNKYKAFHAQEFELGDVSGYHKIRIENNIPEGAFDLIQEKSYPLQYRMEELNGVDFNKGCYVGQEVTARTKHRGVVRKKTYTVKSIGEISSNRGDEIILGDKKIGEFISSQGFFAIVLLDVEFASSNKSFEFQNAKYSIFA